MTDKEIKNEFNRWINAEKPGVWYKINNSKNWYVISLPSSGDDATYIVNDKYAEIRKQLHDNPDLEIECRFPEDRWNKLNDPQFDNPNCEYRIKPKQKYEIVYEWMCQGLDGQWFINNELMTEREASTKIDIKYNYQKTGREFEVEVNSNE